MIHVHWFVYHVNTCIVFDLKGFNEITKLSTQETGNQHMLGALNLKNHEFEVIHTHP